MAILLSGRALLVRYLTNNVCIASFCFRIFVSSNCIHFMDGSSHFPQFLEHPTDKQLRHTIIFSNINYLPSVHLNTHTTTNNNFQDMRQRLTSSSIHPCSEPRYINKNVIFKQTSLLTPLSNVNFGVSPSKIFFYTCSCLLDRRPEKRNK